MFVLNADGQLLNFIYQNSQMGVTTLTQLLPMIEDEQLEKQLSAQLSEYREFHDKAAKLLEKSGKDEKGLSAMEKIRTYLMINMQTITDKSASHIAEMVMIGSNMGVIDAIKNINKYKDKASSDVVALMQRLKEFEENNIERLKKFL